MNSFQQRRQLKDQKRCLLPESSEHSYLYLTVDVEEAFDWSIPGDSGPGKVTGLEDLMSFHSRCIGSGVTPIYLITYQVLKNEQYCSFFKVAQNLGECELGIHLHAWNTPPIQSTESTFQCNLLIEIERNKLTELYYLFQETFGYCPRIHRAGRYGIDADTFDLLEELNIDIDLSPSAGFSFVDRGGPSFTKISNDAFYLREHPSILCLPVPSVAFTRGPDWMNKFSSLFGSFLKRRPVRLTPEGNSLVRMKRMVVEMRKSGLKNIVLTLHSTSLTAGGNPYSMDAEMSEQLKKNTFDFINWGLSVEGIKASTAEEFHKRYRCYEDVSK